MIYQCYPDALRVSRLFGPFYRPFCLDPLVNPNLIHNCPELSDQENRYALSEYAAMLYFWRNPADHPTTWIGFTSYRQVDKVRFIFEEDHLKQLHYCDILTWSWNYVGNVAAQAEACHPGITDAANRTLVAFGIPMPLQWHTAAFGVFCNYWAMHVQTFDEYMAWSYPLVSWMLRNPERIPFLLKYRRHENGVGYLMERLFIVWYCTFRKGVFDLVANQRVAN